MKMTALPTSLTALAPPPRVTILWKKLHMEIHQAVTVTRPESSRVCVLHTRRTSQTNHESHQLGVVRCTRYLVQVGTAPDVPVVDEQRCPPELQAADALVPPSLPLPPQGGGGGNSAPFASLMHTEQRALMRAQRRATLAQALATAPPVRRPFDVCSQLTSPAEALATKSPTHAVAERQAQQNTVHHAQEDPIRKLRQDAAHAVPPSDLASAGSGADKLRDRYGAPFAFHRAPAERLPERTRRAGHTRPSLSPTCRVRAPIAPTGSLEHNGTWPAVPSPARSKSARAPTSRQAPPSPFTQYRPIAEAESVPVSDTPVSTVPGAHAHGSNKLPQRTTDAQEGFVPRSPLTSKPTYQPGGNSLNRQSLSGRLRASHSDTSMRVTLPASFPTQPSLASLGGGSSHSGRLTGRVGDAARVTPPSSYPSKPKQRPTPPRPGLPTPPRGARHDSQNSSDQEEPGAVLGSLRHFQYCCSI